ncbi:MAG: hypothetical protein QOJ81_1847 [Chloroflexota bacterium]|jgi:hypothetical protein|nr:hypothetical protein [Chloroflexota bacterium]
MTIFAEEIQPGWRVIDATGEELGVVISVDREIISIQRRGLLGGVWHAPRDAVDEVETGRVELSLRKDELD